MNHPKPFSSKDQDQTSSPIDFNALLDYVYARRLFDSEHHGIAHWRQVEFNGMLLASETGADVVVVRLFALFHDSKRATDAPDVTHGEQGAGFAKLCFEEHRFDISNEQFEKLYHACKCHTSEHCSGDATIDTCYDADRLDLGRVNIDLDPDKMATSAGARIALESMKAGIKPGKMREWLAALQPENL